MFTIGPDEPAPLERAGGKGRNLAALRALGVPVPAFFIVSTEAPATVLAPIADRLTELLRGVPPGDGARALQVAAEVERLVLQTDWPDDLTAEVARRTAELPAESGLAVRSSAVGEDAEGASFAGQHLTMLHVEDADVPDAIRRCWASGLTDRAILYRQAKGLIASPEGSDRSADSPIRMAVVVQAMVSSVVSGVAFTADPLTGAPGHVIVAGWGLGEGIVSDAVESDTFVRRRGADAWEKSVRRKTLRMVRDRAGGTRTEPVPEALQRRAALEEPALDALAAALDRIESHHGRPQDVEWAFCPRGRLAITQARPITTLPQGRLTILDNSNIVESFPGLTTPLTYSYARHGYAVTFDALVGELGGPRRVRRALRAVTGRLLAHVRGRVYYDVSSYYRLYGSLPGMSGYVRQWETALGMQPGALDDEGNAAAHRLGPVDAGRALARLLGHVLRLRRTVPRFLADFDRFCARWHALDMESMPARALLDALDRILDESLGDWTLTLYNDLAAIVLVDWLARLCGSKTRARASEDGPNDDLHHRLLTGIAGMESVAPAGAIIALTDSARAVPEVADRLRGPGEPRAVWEALGDLPAAAPVVAEAERYLARFGERTTEELKLESVPLSATPWVLVSMMRNYIDLPVRAADLRRREQRTRREAERELARRLRGRPLRRALAARILPAARRAVAARENMRFARCRGYGLLRRVFCAIGLDLARTATIADARDVFWLDLAELRALVTGATPPEAARGRIAARRTAYDGYASEELPARIVCRGDPADLPLARRGRVVAEGELAGVGCSPGVVRGPAKVLRAPSPGERVDGEILVAPTTDPGWVFLMLAAKGLVVEKGSILSHTAIIGRELGIPTVVCAEGATDRIATGDEIEIDGGTGAIRIVNG